MAGREHPNVTQVRRLFAAFRRADPREAHRVVVDGFHADAVWHTIGTRDPLTGRYSSRDDIIERVLRPMHEGSGYTWSMEPLEIVAAGDELVMVHMREAATIDGESRSGSVAVVFRVADGRIVEGMRMPESSLDRHWARVGAPQH